MKRMDNSKPVCTSDLEAFLLCVYTYIYIHIHLYIHIYIHIYICIHTHIYDFRERALRVRFLSRRPRWPCISTTMYEHHTLWDQRYLWLARYGVATISRLLKIIGLFCRISSLLEGSFAKETYNFKEHTNRSHPVPRIVVLLRIGALLRIVWSWDPIFRTNWDVCDVDKHSHGTFTSLKTWSQPMLQINECAILVPIASIVESTQLSKSIYWRANQNWRAISSRGEL